MNSRLHWVRLLAKRGEFVNVYTFFFFFKVIGFYFLCFCITDGWRILEVWFLYFSVVGEINGPNSEIILRKSLHQIRTSMHKLLPSVIVMAENTSDTISKAKAAAATKRELHLYWCLPYLEIKQTDKQGCNWSTSYRYQPFPVSANGINGFHGTNALSSRNAELETKWKEMG